MTPFSLLIDKIHQGVNPYQNFPAAEWSGTWYGDPGAQREIYAKCIAITNPGIIIEVGSFVGESTIHMAKLLKAQGRECAILSVDTWLGGYDHYLGAREKLNTHFGRVSLYYKFLSNVITHGCQDTIVPFSMDSIGAARVLKWLGLVPQFIYLDGSHEQGDVIRDLDHYWELLPSGGGILVDDLSGHFMGVVHDYEQFIKQRGLAPTLIEGEKQLLLKP